VATETLDRITANACANKLPCVTSHVAVSPSVVKTSERALYYVLGNDKAVRYPVGVGRDASAE